MSYHHLGEEAEVEETLAGKAPIVANDNEPAEVVEFDPAKALEAAGMTPPEPVELDQLPEPVEGDLDWKAVVEEAREHYVEPGEALEEPSGNPKDLIGNTKPDLSLVPSAGMLHTSKAMMDGASKYGPYNWRENPVKLRVYIAAAQRHLAQLLDGENFDPLSGVHHAGHAAACMMIILDALETGNLKDDRPLAGPAGEMIRRFGETGTFEK